MNTHPVIYVIGGAAPPIFDFERLLETLEQRGWKPCPILTPTAAAWLHAPHLSKVGGYRVRVNRREPDDEDSMPLANVVLVAPLTFNTANKWAGGLNDTFALGVLNELLATDVPIVATPCVKTALQRHPAYVKSSRLLEDCGVELLYTEYATLKGSRHTTLDWQVVVDRVESAPQRHSLP